MVPSGTRMRRRVHAGAVALLTARPSLWVPRREMIVEPSPATKLNIDYPLTQPGHIRGPEPWPPQPRGFVLSALSPPPATPLIAGIGCVAALNIVRSVLFARVGNGGCSHELVSRHPDMLVMCVGGNGLMIDIASPAVLLEEKKNPGSSSSAL